VSRTENPGALMTVEQFGQRLGLSRTSAWRRVTSGQVAVVNVGSARRPQLRVSEAEYARYVASHLVAAL
jgi:hypothetical protein